ncbi:DUF4041 domain-containing protein [Sphaerochaeta pleomorpha]|nr:DUF4041 domain-containing protein [Sphaerochaeta pleomorpha]
MRTKEKLSESNSKYAALKKQYEQFISVDEYKASIEQELLRIQKESQDHLESNRQEIAQLKKESEDQLSTNRTKLVQETQRLFDERNKTLSDIENQKNESIHSKEQRISTLNQEMDELSTKYNQARTLLSSLLKEVSLFQDEVETNSFGIYSPHFEFDTSEEYKDKLIEIRKESKVLISSGDAVDANFGWTVNGSKAEGKKQTNQYIKLMLRAFNGECEAMVADTRWNNITKMEERMKSVYEAINKLGTVHEISIRSQYLTLKLQELQLTFEYENKKHEEQEEQRKLRDQIREEEKAQREYEKAMKDAADEQKQYQQALNQARKEMEKAQGEELTKLQKNIADLAEKLEEAQNQQQRAISMAQQTKAGNVYVISNVGSFGENVYKIGMTRRLNPQERVNELGDASVPFTFDVHAMIRSDNAPELESYFHNQLDKKRLNLINTRKEFFTVTLREIEELTKRRGMTIEFTKLAEAREFRESIEKRKEFGAPKSEPVKNDLDKFPVNL